MAERIDGKARAAMLREDVAAGVQALVDTTGVRPGLTVVIVGEDPASQVYVRNKGRMAEAAGIVSNTHRLPADVPESGLLALIDRLNADDTVHGILVQLPLPDHIDDRTVINRIDPDKDVDGFHTVNVGRLSIGLDGFVPCTPLGCLDLLKHSGAPLAGAHAVIVGRSNIVGKPMAALLLAEHCTVTIAHSRTKDLAALCRTADILVAAVGRPGLVAGDWVKEGATVIDVGINRIDIGGGKTRLVGDVDYEAAAQRAAAITPVPGGVGPMTIACLLANTLKAAKRTRGRASQV